MPKIKTFTRVAATALLAGFVCAGCFSGNKNSGTGDWRRDVVVGDLEVITPPFAYIVPSEQIEILTNKNFGVAGWYTEQIKWPALRDVDLPAGSMEIRVWIIPALSFPHVLRFFYHDGEWSGFYASENYFVGLYFYQNQHLLNKEQKIVYQKKHETAKPFYQLTPKTSWPELWEKVKALGILTLPDSSTLPNHKFVRDGVSYVVEIKDGAHYRVYRYSNPFDQEWPEAKALLKILETFSEEFAQSRPDETMSWF